MAPLPESRDMISAWTEVKTRSVEGTRNVRATKLEELEFQVAAPHRSVVQKAMDRSLSLELVRFDFEEDRETEPVEPAIAVKATVDRNKEFNFRFQFKLDSSEFVNEERAEDIIDRLKVAIRACKGIVFLVSGHSCDLGDDDHNLELSRQRAERIRALLIAAQVDGEVLIPVGFGERNPMDRTLTEEGRAKNRRVSVVPVERERSAE